MNCAGAAVSGAPVSWRDREKQKIDEWGPSRKEGDVEVRRDERTIRRDDDRGGPRRMDDGPGRLVILKPKKKVF